MLSKIANRLNKGKSLRQGDVDDPLVSDNVLQGILAPSFTDLIPIKHYLGDGVYITRDYSSLVGLLKIKTISIDHFSDENKEEVLKNIQFAITNSVPNEYDKEWISQIYVLKNSGSDKALNQIKAHIKDDIQDSKFTQQYISELSEHLIKLNQKGFKDINANDQLFQLTQYDVYCLIYQNKIIKNIDKSLDNEYIIIKETLELVKNAFQQANINLTECGSQEYVNFLSKMFHCQEIKLPKKVSLNTLDLDLSQIALDKLKITCDKTGLWQFNHQGQQRYSIYSRIDELNEDKIQAGHLSAEQRDRLSLLDRLPNHSVYCQTIVHLHNDMAKDILNKALKKSKGTDIEVVKNRKAINSALKKMSEGDSIYRFTSGVFLNTPNKHDLDKHIRLLGASFNAKGLKIIKPNDNPLSAQDFISALPGAYNYTQDKKPYEKKAFLTQSNILAKISPLYGRQTGTGTPLFTFFNRGGESLFFDPLKDYSENAFALIFGSSGAGKSATLIYMVMQFIAIYNPRIFIIEKGESFSLLVKYCEQMGLSTHRVVVNSIKESMSFSPFAEAHKVLEKEYDEIELIKSLDPDNNTEDENRNILGELIVVAHLMITGGEQKEMDRFERRYLFDISNAIKIGAQKAKEENRITITDDVIYGLKEVAKTKGSNNEQELIRGFADSMNIFINSKFDKKLFNTPGESFPEVDITQLDVGRLGDEGNQDKLAVAFISLMMRINNIAERDQYKDRPILVLGDEAHLYANNPLLAPYIVKIAKMWRKLGAWLWLATQSLDDFTGASERMINIMEWLILLSLKTKEIDILKNFVDLSDEQIALLKSTVSQPGRYKEGVVINQANESIQFLFRNIPPPLALALGMTGKDEKTARHKIMREDNCTELEAVFKIAEQMKALP